MAAPLLGTGGRRGPSAVVRVGHVVAATLGFWEITLRGIVGQLVPDGDWTFTAEVLERDGFWLDQAAAFDLVVETADGQTWRWRGLTRVFNEEKLGFWGSGPPEVM